MSLATGVLIVAACAYDPPPIPMTADETGIAALAGEWTGSYEREAGDRYGDLYFRLELEADTARGDLLMFGPPSAVPSIPGELPQLSSAPGVLTVRFVQAEGNRVSGELDPYVDPDCGCRVRTTFEGRVDGWRVSGTFRTRSLDNERVDGGVWEAQRKRGPANPDALASEPGLRGPTQTEMRVEGERLFRSLGCAECHGADRRGRVGPDLADVGRHREFAWIYHMILRPDSMIRDDPTARRMYEEFDIPMRVTGASPWDALVLYEFLKAEVEERHRSGPPD